MAGLETDGVFTVMSHLAALYSCAFHHELDEDKKHAVWQSLIDTALDDVGLIVEWQNDQQKIAALGARDCESINRRLATLSGRFEVLQQGLNLWTLPERWQRVLLNAESSWIRFIGSLADDGNVKSERMEQILAHARTRAQILKELMMRTQAEKAALEDAWAEPTSMVGS